MSRSFEPRTIWGTGGNFPTLESTAPPPRPQLFVKNTHSVIGDDESLHLSGDIAQRVVCEGELAIVIGTECRRLTSADEARAVIAGYTVANDVTARDLQDVDAHWSRAKGLDGFCPLGAGLVAPVDAPDWDEAIIRTRVDGQTIQHTPVSAAFVGAEELVVWASQQFTLHPGDVFLLGTPDYLPPGREDAAVLRPGSVVEIDIAGIGSLRTPVRGDSG
ncbi:fumarylacetoacetate hydrolase family protein [Gordonia sp. SL306]|uniref:fumarylacetoacetate hydrolase family protein n=1 Tax=Gordonia sp. SL306 TaxID=2995145 RepID=UPI002270CC43|nr:fumarylacetoacetate hydrolase family protein [Gordonia sp. SL306]WAC57528.1 fumarylacetoacetate hydrolase family protein [Gordonia sp. SL306]